MQEKLAGYFALLLYAAGTVGLVWLCVRFILPWAAPFITAYLLAALLEKPVGYLSRHGWRRGAAAALCVLLTLALLLWAAACLAFGWTVMLQNAVGLGLVALGVVECILTLYAAERAGQVGAQIQEKTAFMQDCRKKAAALRARAGTQPMKDACARVSEALRYCDPVSGAELDSVEAGMSAALHRLSRAVDTGDEAEAEKQAETILRLLDERAALQMRTK